MIASVLVYLVGVGSGVLYTICWQQASSADHLDASTEEAER